MTDPAPPPLPRWSQRQRYGFIEQRLYWEGAISRSDLTRRFGISAPQASDDMSNYMDLAPGNVEFDRGRKMFVATGSFEPRFVIPNARHYLTQLLMLADEAIDSNDSWLGAIPAHAAMPRVRRRLDSQTLRPIVKAMHQRRAIEIRYQSMTAPEPSLRWIAPHSLVYDGARWHARSWCYNRSVFNDFVLARILSIGGTRPSGIDALLDREWQEFFTMKLAPHPDLSEHQRQAIEMDYGMTDGVIPIPMRLCMTQYFERHYGLDLPPDSLPAWRRQVILQNRSELDLVRKTFGSAKEPA
jgi:WYL domain